MRIRYLYKHLGSYLNDFRISIKIFYNSNYHVNYNLQIVKPMCNEG